LSVVLYDPFFNVLILRYEGIELRAEHDGTNLEPQVHIISTVVLLKDDALQELRPVVLSVGELLPDPYELLRGLSVPRPERVTKKL